MPRGVVVHHVLARHRARRDEAGDRSHHPLRLRSRLCCRTRREEAAYGHGALGLDGGPERLGRTAGRETARRRQRRRRRTAAWGGQGSTRGGFARRRLVASGCERDGLGGRASLRAARAAVTAARPARMTPPPARSAAVGGWWRKTKAKTAVKVDCRGKKAVTSVGPARLFAYACAA